MPIESDHKGIKLLREALLKGLGEIDAGDVTPNHQWGVVLSRSAAEDVDYAINDAFQDMSAAGEACSKDFRDAFGDIRSDPAIGVEINSILPEVFVHRSDDHEAIFYKLSPEISIVRVLVDPYTHVPIREILSGLVPVRAHFPINYAARIGDLDAIRKSIINSENLDVTNNIGITPLVYAIMKDHENIALELIAAGAKIDGDTLRSAAGFGRLEVLKAMLATGVSPDLPARDGTALMMAVRNGHKCCVMELLRRCANVNAQNSKGKTALHFAPIGSPEVADMLLMAGAIRSLTDSDGRDAAEHHLHNAQWHRTRKWNGKGRDPIELAQQNELLAKRILTWECKD